MDDILRVNSHDESYTHKITSVDTGPIAVLTFPWSHRRSSGRNESSPPHYPSPNTCIFKTKHRLAISSFHLRRPTLSSTIYDARRTRIFRRTAHSHFASPFVTRVQHVLLTHTSIIFLKKKNDRKRKKAGMNSSSPPNPQYPYPPHHTHHLHPPTPTLTTSATFSPQHQQPLRLSSVFPLHDSATSPSVPRLKYHPSHSNSHVK